MFLPFKPYDAVFRLCCSWQCFVAVMAELAVRSFLLLAGPKSGYQALLCPLSPAVLLTPSMPSSSSERSPLTSMIPCSPVAAWGPLSVQHSMSACAATYRLVLVAVVLCSKCLVPMWS
jgi:hypothetical protein